MRLLHSRDSWYYHQEGNPAIDFCLWVLRVDGLCVPPFDQHPDGDGSLRALGLTAEDWQTWFLRTLDPAQRNQDTEHLQQLLLDEYLKISGEPDLEHLQQRYRAEQLKISADPPLPPPPEFYSSQSSWKGSTAIKSRLIELEKQYRQISHEYNKWREDMEMSLQWAEDKAAGSLYNDLKPYHNRIPPLNIYTAVYESPLDYLVTPATLLITIQEGQPQLQEFRERVLAAVAELASKDRRRKSTYTRIGKSSDQFIAYRRQKRGSIQSVPLPPRPEKPRFDDQCQQLIIDELWDEPWLHGPVDSTTIRFLRKKQRPGWRLYEVTFQDLDGGQCHMIAILQQTDDGSWRYHGGGAGGSDTRDQSEETCVPVRDHPLLFLGMQGFIMNNQQYLLLAHGDVIDNGFQVERVRLVNDVGQVLVDVVEDGYVFFICKPEELVQLPMQAELYDRQSKLVWRQSFPDQILPPWLKLEYQL